MRCACVKSGGVGVRHVKSGGVGVRSTVSGGVKVCMGVQGGEVWMHVWRVEV